MTNLEKNIEAIRGLMYYYPDLFKDTKLSNGNIECNGKSVSLNNISVWEIINSNENLRGNINKVTSEQLIDILKINELVMSSSLKSTSSNVYEHNKIVVGNIKQHNDLIKNVTIINKDHDFLHEQYFNIVDSHGNTRIFKNDRGVDITRIYNEFIATNGQDNLDKFIDIVSRTLPEIDLVNTNVKNDSKMSEDFENKLEETRKEFEGQMGIVVYGNEKEDMIVIVDKQHPENNETRTYKRDEKNNLVVEKYKQNLNDERVKENNEENQEEKINNAEAEKKEEIKELIPYEEFIKLINSEIPLTEEQKENVKLWEQTLGDIFIYEDFLSSEVVAYLRNYQMRMQEFEINKNNNMLNKNQENALNKYYEMTDPSLKQEKLQNMSEERKNDMVRKLVLQANGNKAGKVSLVLIVGMLLLSFILIGYTFYLIFR